jgi:TrmH family RNA methyltransferase
MLSKNQLRFLQSLSVKKIREKSGLYIAEGEKITEELLNSDSEIKHLFATPFWIKENEKKIKKINVIEIKEQELKKVSQLTTPNEVLAVVQIPSHKITIDTLKDKLSIALDDIRDPGNLGTIIRIADWFGIENIICSKQTVDCFNHKVVQAAMGSLLRVKVNYFSLETFLSEASKNKIMIYGTLLDGKNIYDERLSDKGIVVIGNESKGISTNVQSIIQKKISIPTYSKNMGAESLNAAIATAVICAEFKRQYIPLK